MTSLCLPVTKPIMFISVKWLYKVRRQPETNESISYANLHDQTLDVSTYEYVFLIFTFSHMSKLRFYLQFYNIVLTSAYKGRGVTSLDRYAR